MRSINIKILNQYGVKRVFVDSEEHKGISILTGKKTLSVEHIGALYDLGFVMCIDGQEFSTVQSLLDHIEGYN